MLGMLCGLAVLILVKEIRTNRMLDTMLHSYASMYLTKSQRIGSYTMTKRLSRLWTWRR